MRLFSRLLTTVIFALTATAALASTGAPQSGIDYRALETPQNTDAGKKIEVIEFFWYSCPHCYAFDPALTEWVKKQGDNIVFKRVHVWFRDSFTPQQKLYFTLEALGRVEDMNKKVFSAIHVEHNPLDNDAAILAFALKNGIDRQKFLDAYNSFSVQSKLTRARQLQDAYKIDQVPLVAIDGKYVTSPAIAEAGMDQSKSLSEASMQQAAIQVMDALVAKAIKEKTPAAAPAAAPKASPAKTAPAKDAKKPG